MIEAADWKLIASIVSAIIYLVAMYPYIRDVFAKKTQPHIYTWLIWMITQGTAVAGLLIGGGKIASIPLLIGLCLICFVFLLAFKYGTKNINFTDTVSLVAAMVAVLIWWQLNNPLLAIIIVSMIDGLGYMPTFRKSYAEPWSETKLTWLMTAVANLLIILAIEQYNLLTLTYVSTLLAANVSLYTLLSWRRKFVPKPKLF